MRETVLAVLVNHDYRWSLPLPFVLPALLYVVINYPAWLLSDWVLVKASPSTAIHGARILLMTTAILPLFWWILIAWVAGLVGAMYRARRAR